MKREWRTRKGTEWDMGGLKVGNGGDGFVLVCKKGVFAHRGLGVAAVVCKKGGFTHREGSEGSEDRPVIAVVTGEEDAEEEGPGPEAGKADAGVVVGGVAVGRSRRRR